MCARSSMVEDSRKSAGFYEKQATKHLSLFSMEMKVIFKNPPLHGNAIWSHKAPLVSHLQRCLPMSHTPQYSCQRVVPPHTKSKPDL